MSKHFAASGAFHLHFVRQALQDLLPGAKCKISFAEFELTIR
jgi:hypothetical protein